MEMAGSDLVRVFELDPELVEDLEPAVATHLRQRLAAHRIWLQPGRWEPAFSEEEARGHLGLLVLDGFLVRTVRLAGRDCSEVVGPGDLIRPWDPDDGDSVECTTDWRVLQPVSFADLDRRFAERTARWPAIEAALLRRATRRSRTLVYQATIAHVRHADSRILLLLWQLADRWGRVTPGGVRVPVPLTHQIIAQLTCLQRPTVSAAISRLGAVGEISRLEGAGWVLHREPPTDWHAVPPGSHEERSASPA